MTSQEIMGKSLNLKQLYALIIQNKNYIKALDAQGKVDAEVRLLLPFVPDDSYKALALEDEISCFYINFDSQFIKTQIIKNLQELEDEARKLEEELGIEVK